MKIEEILKKEDTNQDKIYLYAEGIFWKAYDRSAFLFINYVKAYNVKLRHFKKLNRDVKYLGFPMTALNNLITEEHPLHEIVKGKQLIISGFETIDQVEFEKWNVEQIVEKENLKSDNEDLAAKVIHFPVLEKSPLDCQSFILQLQKELNGTI